MTTLREGVHIRSTHHAIHKRHHQIPRGAVHDFRPARIRRRRISWPIPAAAPASTIDYFPFEWPQIGAGQPGRSPRRNPDARNWCTPT